MVGEQLQRHGRDQRLEQGRRVRHVDDVAAPGPAIEVVALGGDGDDDAVAGAHLFDVAEHLGVVLVLHGDRDDRHALVDQRDGAVLHLAGGVALGVDVADLLELERALHRDGVLQAAAEEEEVLRAGVALGDGACAGCVRLQRLADQLRHAREVVQRVAERLASRKPRRSPRWQASR